MSRKLVIGDIHGGYLGLLEILQAANVKTNDILIFLGDYVDGWSQSKEVLDLLILLNKNQKCIFIKGNHDQIFLDYLLKNNKEFNEKIWFEHGGKATVASYKNIDKQKMKTHVEFLKNLKNYHTDSENNLFIHAGFTNMKGVNHEYFEKTFYWDRTLWETALSLNNEFDEKNILYPKRFTLYKEIYIGHTPTTRINKTTPQKFANVWNIDTGAAFKGPLSIMDIKTKEFWQSKPLNELYPSEKGRN